MEDHNTIVQLKKALNQLLNAYESLKGENLKLTEDLEKLEGVNSDLNEKLNSLNDTTDRYSIEMSEMLEKIESTLVSEDDEKKDDAEEDEFCASISKDLSEDENSIENNDIVSKEENQIDTPFSNNNQKDIDLGRMQSLLNGFNN